MPSKIGCQNFRYANIKCANVECQIVPTKIVPVSIINGMPEVIKAVRRNNNTILAIIDVRDKFG